MKNYFITGGERRRIPTEIVHIAIPDNMVVIARRNKRNPNYTTPNEIRRDRIYMFRFGYPHVSITNRCW